ncbi:SGNH/GDSL hydrolase family protein [Streptomyces sp. ISL-90]|nr:SGNH/GDSL hydrolase family protein [Streptomyces sp. ISL-90]
MELQRMARLRRVASIVASSAVCVALLTGCGVIVEAPAARGEDAATSSPADATPPPVDPSSPPADSTRGVLVEASGEADLRGIPQDAAVLIIGDSFTEAYGASSADAGWASIAVGTLGWSATIDGVGGTGFTEDLATDGRVGVDFGPRLEAHARNGEQYDVIVLQGGLNDWAADSAVESDKVRATIETARREWPSAAVIVFGPTAPPASDHRLRNLTTIRTAAIASGATFIDPSEPRRWINAGNTDRFDVGDGLHLNDAGYAYLAARFVSAIEALTS